MPRTMNIGSGSFKTFIELSELMHLSFLKQQRLHYSLTVKRVSLMVLQPPSLIVHTAIIACDTWKIIFIRSSRTSSLNHCSGRLCEQLQSRNSIKPSTTCNQCSVDWLLSHAAPEHWAEMCFLGRCYGHLTSNIMESQFVAREMPILAMFEQIRHQFME